MTGASDEILQENRKIGPGSAVGLVMARKSLLLLLTLGVLGAGWVHRSETSATPATAGPTEAKRVIGQTARVEIAEAGMDFLGRVDTGAASTSVHAESVQVDGDMVDFVIRNKDGERMEMRAPIMKRVLVRNPEGREKRVYVELTVSHDGVAKTVLANLNDRSGLTYALLLGRDWLQDDFVVDVSREEALPPLAAMASESSAGADSSKVARR